MNNAFLVGMLERATDLDKELKPFFGGKFVLVAVLGDFDSTDQLHHKKGPTAVGGAGVEDPGDIGVVHERQGLALGFKAGNDAFGIHAQLDYLEGNPAANRFFLLGHVDHTATAFADLLEKLVTTQPVSRLFGDRQIQDDGALGSSRFGGLRAGPSRTEFFR
jgi:hypothetical protein